MGKKIPLTAIFVCAILLLCFMYVGARDVSELINSHSCQVSKLREDNKGFVPMEIQLVRCNNVYPLWFIQAKCDLCKNPVNGNSLDYFSYKPEEVQIARNFYVLIGGQYTESRYSVPISCRCVKF
ncbi:uncharacterized protein LOC120338478 [Styela clava]